MLWIGNRGPEPHNDLRIRAAEAHLPHWYADDLDSDPSRLETEESASKSADYLTKRGILHAVIGVILTLLILGLIFIFFIALML